MKVLVLSPYPGRITGTFAREGDTVLACSDPIDRSFLSTNMIDWVVSYGYRHILKADVVTAYRDRIVNLHISLLPWNRGADPNFWSFIDGTPKGVTIHRIDEGVDTGPILVQRAVHFSGGETLATSFARLCSEIETLFDEMWCDIRNGRCVPRCHDGVGSYHRSRDKDVYFESLPMGWETPVADVEALGRRTQATRRDCTTAALVR